MFKRALCMAAVGALALGVAACSSSGGSSSSASGSLPTVKLMVGGIDKQIYLPYQLAQDLGYYKKYGVNVQLSTEQNGGVGAEDAMASGQVDMAGAWYIHTIDFQAKGKQVVDVVQLSGAPGEREMCGTNSGVHSAADFKGKSLGVTDLGSGTDELTQFLASQHGIGHSDYHTVAAGAGSTAIAAIQRNSVQCVMTTQPTVGALESKHLAYPAIDLATTAGAKAALGGAWPAAGVLAQADWVKSHQKETQKRRRRPRRDDALDQHPFGGGHRRAHAGGVRLEQHDQQGAVHLRPGHRQGPVPAGRDHAGRRPEDHLRDGEGARRRCRQGEARDTFTNSYAMKANKLEGSKVTTTPAGSSG